MSDKQVCVQCGSDNIEVQAWVDANTLEYKSESGDYDVDSNWCNKCEDHVEFCTEEEFKQKQENETE